MTRLFLFVFCISCAALAYEIVLIRLLEIIQDSSVIGVVIALALLGFGYSGTILCYLNKVHQKGSIPRNFLAANALLFSTTAILGIMFVEKINYNPGELLWSTKPFFLLFLYFFCLSLPFFFASNCINIAMIARPTTLNRIYLNDSLGAGAGALLGYILLQFCQAQTALLLVCIMGLLAASLMAESRIFRLLLAAFVVAACVYTTALPSFKLQMSPYKALAKTLMMTDVQLVKEKSSAYAQLEVVSSPSVPFRFAAGLSLRAKATPPPQLGVFVNGGTFLPVSQNTQLEFFADIPESLPYQIRQAESVLQVGLSSGELVKLARFYEARRLTVLERNEDIFSLIQSLDSSFRIPLRENDVLVFKNASVFLTTTQEKYDLIHISETNASPSGLSISENDSQEALTQELFASYRSHLKEEGFLSISLWTPYPPCQSLKTWQMLLKEFPPSNLFVIASLETVLILAKKSAFTDQEKSFMTQFSSDKNFQVLFPTRDLESNESRIFQLLALGTDAEKAQFIKSYPLDISIATLDKPYILNCSKSSFFGRWLLEGANPRFFPIETSYFHLWAAAVMALFCALLFIIFPLFPVFHASKEGKGILFWFAFCIFYFLIGLAFMLVEVSMIQKLRTFYGQSVFATSFTISVFLIAGGLGSLLAKRIVSSSRRLYLAPIILFALVAYGAIIASYLIPYSAELAGASPLVQLLGIFLVLIPLAFLMGFPFVLGVQTIGETTSQFISWAWAVNGASSVVGAILAQLSNLHFGFQTTFLVALLLYAFAGILLYIILKALAVPFTRL